MKLHLPNKLRRMLMSCLALSYSGFVATTISTAGWGAGLCLVAWQQALAEEVAEDGESAELPTDSEIIVESGSRILSENMGGNGTLSKLGAGTLILAGDLEHEGSLLVKEGVVQWGERGTQSEQNGQTLSASDNYFRFKSIEVESGATFAINHAAADASDTNIKLSGGTLSISGSIANLALNEDTGVVEEIDGVGEVSFGTLEMNGNGNIAATAMPGESTNTNSKWTLSFKKLTGTGDLSIASMYGTEEYQAKTIRIDAIHNYEGTITSRLYGITTRFIIGTVHQDAGFNARWNVNEGYGSGDRIAQDFRKTGEGSFSLVDGRNRKFIIDASPNSEFWMTYEGSLNLDTAPLLMRFNSGVTLRYDANYLDHMVVEANAGSLTYDFKSSVYVLASDFSTDQLTAGVYLGLPRYARSVVTVKGQDKYEFYYENDMLYLRFTDDKDWEQMGDANANAPDAGKTLTMDDFVLDPESQQWRAGLQDATDIVNSVLITDESDLLSGSSIYGGSAVAKPELAGRQIEIDSDDNTSDVWIKVTGGELGNVVGGNFGDNDEVYSVVKTSPFYWVANKGGFAHSFIGDVHILFGDNSPDAKNQPKAECIVGGNYGNSLINDTLVTASGLIMIENERPIETLFVGDTSISIYGGDVDWVCGGSYQTIFDFIHGADYRGRASTDPITPDRNKYSEGAFVGNSKVFVYSSLENTTSTHDNAAHDFIAGGNLVDIAKSYELLRTRRENPTYEASNPIWWGDPDDMSKGFWNHVISTPFYFIGNSYIVVDLKDKYKNANTTFGKSIVGGDYIRNDKGWVEHIGNTYIYINGADGVTFTERIFGGNYDDGSSYTHLAGSTWVIINSGTFKTMVVGGSNQGSLDESKGAQGNFRQALSCVIDGETFLDIRGGSFTGRTSTIKEMIPQYVLPGETPNAVAIGDPAPAQSINHSIGRISIVGGNYISRGANAERNSTTVNTINGVGSKVSISGGSFSGHIIGATVIEGNNGTREHLEGEWLPPQPIPEDGMYLMSEYYMGFRAHLYVEKSYVDIQNATMCSPDGLTYDDDSFAPEIWNPRIVGGYMIHLAADNLVPNLLQMQNDANAYKPQIKIGDIDVSISRNSQVFDVVGGSWTACLDVSADEVRDWRRAHPNYEGDVVDIPDDDPHKGGNDLGIVDGQIAFKGVEQGRVHVFLDNVTVNGDVIAGGIQGGISKITSEKTEVVIGDGVYFDMYENPYRPKNNVITGGYMSARKKDLSACQEILEENLKDNPNAVLKWDDELDPFDTFYEAAAYEKENQNTGLNVSYVTESRDLIFSAPMDYGQRIFDSILLNFDYVKVTRQDDKNSALVRAAGLLITDTQDWEALRKQALAEGLDEDFYVREAITLYGGGEMQLSPDYMLVPEWIVPEGETSHTVPSVADRYKWLHNNSYTIVTGQGINHTTLRLLAREKEGRDGWIMNGMEYTGDDMLHVQKLWVKEGGHLVIEQDLAETTNYGFNAQPVAVRDVITIDVDSRITHVTNISLDEMRTREDAAIRWDLDISSLRTDNQGKPLDGYVIPKQTHDKDAYTVVFKKPTSAAEKPTYTLDIQRVEKNFYNQDKFRRYLIDYVNPEAFGSAWAKELGEESSVTDGSITYTDHTKEILDKWFAKSPYINGYDKYRIRVKDNDDGTFSLVIEGMRIKQGDTPETPTETPDTPPDTPPGPPEPPPGPPEPPPTPPDPPTLPPGYHEKHGRTRGGHAGGRILDEFYPDPSENSEDRDKVLDRVFELNVEGRETEGDRLMAAVAGSSIPALGMAVTDDVERQLRLIRNRAAKNLRKDAVRMRQRQVDGGKAGILIHEYPEVLPPNRYSMWVNGEGDFRQMDAKGTDSGYRVNAWGGTLGGSCAITENVEAGLAITAMYGDFRSKGPDALNGDLDTSYLSSYVRVDSGRWSHLFIATLGLVDVDATRTVNIGGGYGGYSTHVDTQGYALGLMYELGYTFMLNREKTAMLQPIVNIAWSHVVVDGFTESGSDAALRADRQEPEIFVLGTGARSQMLLGARSFNRNMLLELRALVKGYLGSLRNSAGVGFADRSCRVDVRSRRQSPLGLEVGAGLSIPLTSDTDWDHSIFVDLNLELRNGLDNANFTVGYKIGF